MFLLLFVIIDLYFLIPAVITQIFITAAELAGSIEIPAKEAEVEIERYQLTVEAKISKCLAS